MVYRLQNGRTCCRFSVPSKSVFREQKDEVGGIFCCVTHILVLVSGDFSFFVFNAHTQPEKVYDNLNTHSVSLNPPVGVVHKDVA